MSLEELKPCPFCGGEAAIIEITEGDDAGGSCVECTRCHASSNLEFGRKENFAANWNRREFVKGCALVDLKGHDTIADMILTHIDVWKNELVRRRNRCAENGDSVDVDYYNHELIALKDIELALSTTGAKQ